MKHSPLILFVLVVLVMACKPTVPSSIIPPSDMEDLLYDYHVALAMAREDYNSDEVEFARTKYCLAVLKKHDVTEAEFDSSLVYYYSHVDYLKKIYSGVNERLTDEAKVLGASVGEIGHYSQYSATGDTANIWKLATSVLLLPRPTMNRFDFTVKADTSYYKGDSFMFQFQTEYIWQSGTKDAVVCLLTKYEGDSITQTVNHVSVSGTSQIRVPVNRDGKLKEMEGFIYLSDGGDDANVRKMMFISQMQLIRFHNKDINDGTSKTDSLQTDSLQRSDNSRGAMPDSIRRRTIGRRMGGTPVPPPSRDALHRVDTRSVELKTRQ